MNGRKNLGMLLAVCVFLAALAPAAAADTIYVDPNGSADFTQIQMAINASWHGDQIEVAPGTYNENIDFLGMEVKLYSRDGADVTIIHGMYMYNVVQCVNFEGPNTIMQGFTITGGQALYFPPFEDGCGGGMYNFYSSPTVNDCNFTDNWADANGGGMYNEGGSPTVTNCTFYWNYAWGFMEDAGGGGMCNNGSSPTVTNCLFTEGLGGFGAGMYNLNNSSPTVTNCSFTGNWAVPVGGGMANFNNSSPTVTNCSFSENEASQGAGMFNGDSSPTVTNCIFWGDEDDEIYDAGSSSPTVTYCDVQGGYSGTGNKNLNPVFINPATADLRLGGCSPCVDAGNNSAPALPATDLDGNPRLVDDTGVADTGSGTPPIVDMGAYERQGNSVVWGTINVAGRLQQHPGGDQ